MTYHLTLIEDDGTLIASADSLVLPRFLHMHHVEEGQIVELSDEPAPDETIDGPVLTFARIASAVWVDDERAALFVRLRS